MKKLCAAFLRSFRGQHSDKMKGSARGNWDPREGQQPFRPNPNGVGDCTTTLRLLLIGVVHRAFVLRNGIVVFILLHVLVSTFIAFLRDIESPYDVKDYVKSYLGESRATREFAESFIEQRNSYMKQQRQNKGKKSEQEGRKQVDKSVR